MGKVEKEWTAGFIFNMFLHHTEYEASCLQKKLDVYVKHLTTVSQSQSLKLKLFRQIINGYLKSWSFKGF